MLLSTEQGTCKIFKAEHLQLMTPFVEVPCMALTKRHTMITVHPAATGLKPGSGAWLGAEAAAGGNIQCKVDAGCQTHT